MLAIIAGPLGCLLWFCCLIVVTWLSNRYILCFPRFFSKLVVWYGLGAIGDPFMIAVVDLSLRERTGDIVKLYYYYQDSDGTGFAGLVIAVILYAFMFMLALVVFYNYIIFHHHNGRLQDIYVRLVGNPKAFFIPDDNELSLKHLLWAYNVSIRNSYRIVVNKLFVRDPKMKRRSLTAMQISKYDTKTSLKHWRSFVKDEIGRIKELNEEEMSRESAIEHDVVD